MSRTPQSPFLPPRPRHARAIKPVIAPTGRFRRSSRLRIATQRSPENVTRINPEEMRPILPEMIYIPPA